MKAFSTAEGFVPEQVWTNNATLTSNIDGGWSTLRPASKVAGAPTDSAAPLSWAMGEYISLVASIAQNKMVDVPRVVCERYNTCTPVVPSGKVKVGFKVTHGGTALGQQVYVTGNTAELGNWNTDLAIPVVVLDTFNASTQVGVNSWPNWSNSLNLAPGASIQYKYFVKDASGNVVSWEPLPGGGNRSLTVGTTGNSLVNTWGVL